jgi:hypothetical protein
MKHLLLFLALLDFGCMQHVFAQNWQKTYGQPNVSEMCYSSKSSYDMGFIIGSRVNDESIWLIKTGVNGNQRYSTLIKPTNYYLALSSVYRKNDGGLILGSSYVQWEAGGWVYPGITSLNNCGELQWCKHLEIEGYDNRIKEATPGNYIMYTRYASINFQEESNQLWGIDSNGIIKWFNQIVPNNEVVFNSSLINDFTITSDGGFLLTGYCYYPDPQNPGWNKLQYLLVKTDSIGNAEWIQPNSLDTNNIGALYSCIQHGNAYYSVGFWYGPNDTIVPPCLNKYDLNGNLIYKSILHSDTLNNMLVDIDVLNDSTLAMVGKCTHGYFDPIYMGVFTADTLGNLIHSFQNENGAPLEECLSITADKKLFCTGYTPIDYSSPRDAFAIKLNANLEYDSVYTQAFAYDSLCPYPIVSDTIICNCEPFVSVKEAEISLGKITISPNPAKEWFTVGFPQSLQQAGTVRIYDILGRAQYSEVLTPGQKQTKINGEGWKSGLYFVKCQSGGLVLSGKVVVF